MSSLWTPGGEHPVDREAPPSPASTHEAPESMPIGAIEELLARLPEEERGEYERMLAGLTDEQRAEYVQRIAEMAATQQQVVETPVEVLVGNHAMGLYELAALHLQQHPPNLREGKLAIDAMAALLDGVTGRLGEHEADIKAALTQIQLGFVQVKSTVTGVPDA